MWELRFVLPLAMGQLRVGELLSRALRPPYCLGEGCPLTYLFTIYAIIRLEVTIPLYDN